MCSDTPVYECFVCCVYGYVWARLPVSLYICVPHTHACVYLFVHDVLIAETLHVYTSMHGCTQLYVYVCIYLFVHDVHIAETLHVYASMHSCTQLYVCTFMSCMYVSCMYVADMWYVCTSMYRLVFVGLWIYSTYVCISILGSCRLGACGLRLHGSM